MKLKIIILLVIMFPNSDRQAVLPTILIEKGGVYNPHLTFVHAPDGWTGNKVNKRNMFVNIDSEKILSLGDVIRWKLKRNPQEKEKKADTFKLQVETDTSFLNNKEDVMVWLGHSIFYIRIKGVSMITDPVFFDMPFVKKLHTMPFDPDMIKQLDYILISHNHRDHCDKKSLKLLSENNPKAVILAGLGMQSILSKWVPNKVQEAGWYQKYQTPGFLNIVFLPTQHWSKRGLTDTNHSLWGSFSIEVDGHKIYFAGDTGWGSHFDYIGKNFGPFDVCLMPIGAYAPRWFMKLSHISPEDALEAFKLLQGRTFIPMHYGTFDLSDEPVGEPIRLIKQHFVADLQHSLFCPMVGRVEQVRKFFISVK